MAYTKTNWVNGYTPLNASNMNKIEEGIFNNDTFLSSLDIRVEDLENSIGQGGIGSINISGDGNAVTNASYDSSNKILNLEKNNTFALDSDNKKSLYHLGAYDSISGNVITRQTGYRNVSKWFLQNAGNLTFRSTAVGYQIGKDGGNGLLSNPYLEGTLATGISNKDFIFADDNASYGNTSNYILNSNWISLPNTFNTKESYLNYFSQNEIIIQYKLAFSYTEEIIENQPLTTLDQSGSQWLRSEWEKGLNLLTRELKKDQFNHSGFYFECKQTGVYTFSIPIGITYINCDYSDNSGNVGTAINSSELIVNLTAGKSYIFLLNNGDWDGALDFLNTAMLNEGTHAYPYQEYRGGIARESQLIKVKTFSGDTSTFSDFTSWIDSNNERVISIMYYERSSGGNNYYNVIFGSDGSVYKYIDSEGTLNNVTLSSGSEGADILKIYYI